MKEALIKLSDLQELFQNKHKYFKKEIGGHQGVSDGAQGEYDETFKIYQHPSFPENVFLRETWNTDSYGSNPHITRIDLVEATPKTITIYEII